MECIRQVYVHAVGRTVVVRGLRQVRNLHISMLSRLLPGRVFRSHERVVGSHGVAEVDKSRSLGAAACVDSFGFLRHCQGVEEIMKLINTSEGFADRLALMRRVMIAQRCTLEVPVAIVRGDVMDSTRYDISTIDAGERDSIREEVCSWRCASRLLFIEERTRITRFQMNVVRLRFAELLMEPDGSYP